MLVTRKKYAHCQDMNTLFEKPNTAHEILHKALLERIQIHIQCTHELCLQLTMQALVATQSLT
uniref:Uncharacterized protein n=1 Tax=Rhizophora mucronata TaxID=61149 RepID=A0A2P2R454_RHIMU